MKREGFRPALNGPEAGWLAVVLEAPGQHYEFAPSCIPYDSVSLLAAALLSVLDGRETIVPWNDEPALHEFRFSRVGATVELTVFALHPRAHGEVEPEAVFNVRGTSDEVLLPLWRALRALEGRFTPEEYHRRWREPFPAAAVAEFGRRLRIARS